MAVVLFALDDHIENDSVEFFIASLSNYEYIHKQGFVRFYHAWIEKYKKLGYLGGTIKINHLTEEEKNCLGGLLGLDLTNGILSLSFQKLSKILQGTYFEDVDFLKTLEYLYGGKINTNKAGKKKYEDQFVLFEESLLNKYRNTPAYKWLNNYFDTDRFIKRYYNENKIYYKKVLMNVCDALNHLPIYNEEYQLLAIFSQTITKNPHYFDADLPKELLIKGISELLDINSSSYNEIFYSAGILKDDLSNFCYICHIQPIDNIGYNYFYENYEPLNINLYNLNRINKQFLSSKILIIENPSVFRELMQIAKEKRLNIGLVCSNGQINLCTYHLLDKLLKSHCRLYYCGDFDPEGLLIADKLKQKYRAKIVLWQYTKFNFEKSKIYQPTISQRRQTILDNIQDSLLKEMASYIKSTSCFAY